MWGSPCHPCIGAAPVFSTWSSPLPTIKPCGVVFGSRMGSLAPEHPQSVCCDPQHCCSVPPPHKGFQGTPADPIPRGSALATKPTPQWGNRGTGSPHFIPLLPPHPPPAPGTAPAPRSGISSRHGAAPPADPPPPPPPPPPPAEGSRFPAAAARSLRSGLGVAAGMCRRSSPLLPLLLALLGRPGEWGRGVPVVCGARGGDEGEEVPGARWDQPGAVPRGGVHVLGVGMGPCWHGTPLTWDPLTWDSADMGFF